MQHKIRFRHYGQQEYFKVFILFAIVLLFVSFLVAPLCTLFLKAFQNQEGAMVGFQNFVNYIGSKSMKQSFVNTIVISSVSTIISVSTAFFFTYALTRRNVIFKRGLQFVSMLPIFSPTMLLGLSLIYLFGNKGLLTQIGVNIPLYGKLGIIIAESIYCFPVAVMILTVAFSTADNRLYEAAEVLNAGKWRKLFTITIPGIKYGLINAIFVCFTYSFTDFGAPSVVGGNYNVLATDIYKQVIGQQNFNMGAVVGMIMMIPTIISFIVDRITSTKQSGAISSKSIPYQIRANWKADIIADIFCFFIVILLIGFFMVSFLASIITLWPYNMKFTLAHYEFSKVAAGAGAAAVKNSIIVSCATAILGTIFTFVMAYCVEKINILPKLRRLIYMFAITPTAIPGTVIGLAYILFFNAVYFKIPGTGYAFMNQWNGLYGTLRILVIVNIVHYMSVPFVTATTSLKKLDKEFEIVSESLKVPFYKTFFQITVPMSAPAILEMIAYYFMNSMVTVSAVIFLYTPVTRLASVVILNVQGAGDEAEAAALCMVLLGINIVVRLLYEFAKSRVTKKTQGWLKR